MEHIFHNFVPWLELVPRKNTGPKGAGGKAPLPKGGGCQAAPPKRREGQRQHHPKLVVVLSPHLPLGDAAFLSLLWVERPFPPFEYSKRKANWDKIFILKTLEHFLKVEISLVN